MLSVLTSPTVNAQLDSPGPESHLNSLTQQTLCASRSPQLDCQNLNSLLDCPARVKISTNWPDKRSAHPVATSWIGLTAFLKNHQISSPSLPSMTSFTPQSYFLSGVFIMTFVIVISSAHERELYSMCAPALIVQSPTKPNDKIWLTKMINNKKKSFRNYITRCFPTISDVINKFICRIYSFLLTFFSHYNFLYFSVLPL